MGFAGRFHLSRRLSVLETRLLRAVYNESHEDGYIISYHTINNNATYSFWPAVRTCQIVEQWRAHKVGLAEMHQMLRALVFVV